MSQEDLMRRSDLFEFRKRLGERQRLVLRSDGKADGLIPQRFSAAFRAFGSRRSYDQMLVLSEDMGFVLAATLRLFGWRGRLNIIVHAGHGARRRLFFKLTESKIVQNYMVYCERQRQVLIDEAGIAPEKVFTLLNPVDTVFFDPKLCEPSDEADSGYIFSCGLENRDYTTLVKAAEASDLKFVVQATGYFEENLDALDRLENLELRQERVSFERLRQMYQNSAFVVVPLNPVDYAAGVNGILEAMAMGKAVIAMQSPGLKEYIEVEGVRVVPAGDADLLLQAMKDLKASPDLCREMGAINRAWVEANCEVSDYADRVERLMR